MSDSTDQSPRSSMPITGRDGLPWNCPAPLREAASALPAVPGVYLFMGDGTVPLYIGKAFCCRVVPICSSLKLTLLRPSS